MAVSSIAEYKQIGLPPDCRRPQKQHTPFSQVHNAYLRLTHDQLVLFLKIRNLPTSGTGVELAFRLANHDFHTYHFSRTSDDHNDSLRHPSDNSVDSRPRPRMTPDLPVEILTQIIDHVGDWELATAVGIPTSLSRPQEWYRATRTDRIVLTGHLPLIRAALPSPKNNLTKIGAVLSIRFGYVDVIEYFRSQHHQMFLEAYKGDPIPIKASRHGRICVLTWWKHALEHHPKLVPPPAPESIAEAIDGASSNGQVVSLDWWLSSGLPFKYTEAALEYASAKNQIAVLDWWKRQHELTGLPLKPGRAIDMASTAGHGEVLEWWATSQLEFKYDRHALQHASCHGKVEVLNWWLRSGLQMIFDQEALTGATRYNRPEVLEWWNKSGLPIQYRVCDIEEALEDAIGGGGKAREWWKRKGVDFNANDKEWMKLQNLN